MMFMRILMDELNNYFLPYCKILDRFKRLNIKTKYGEDITHKDLRKAVSVMLKKISTCKQRSEKILSRRYYVIIEGYLWLIDVYFKRKETSRC